MSKKKLFKTKCKVILIIMCFFIIFLYFLVFRAWYRPMYFDVNLFDDLAKVVDECGNLDELYNKLNKSIFLDGAEYEYEVSLENDKILVHNYGYDSDGPINATWGEIREKTNTDNVSGFFFDDVNNFEGVYMELKNKYALFDPFYKFLVYKYSSESVSVYLTPLTKNRDYLFQKSNPIVALYIETSDYIFVFGFDFEWEYPKKTEENIEFVLEQLLQLG